MPVGPGAIDVGGFISWNDDNPVIINRDGRDANHRSQGHVLQRPMAWLYVEFGAPPPPPPV
jgi:hypothetical protein